MQERVQPIRHTRYQVRVLADSICRICCAALLQHHAQRTPAGGDSSKECSLRLSGCPVVNKPGSTTDNAVNPPIDRLIHTIARTINRTTLSAIRGPLGPLLRTLTPRTQREHQDPDKPARHHPSRAPANPPATLTH